jgi:hypothetical protein
LDPSRKRGIKTRPRRQYKPQAGVQRVQGEICRRLMHGARSKAKRAPNSRMASVRALAARLGAARHRGDVLEVLALLRRAADASSGDERVAGILVDTVRRHDDAEIQGHAYRVLEALLATAGALGDATLAKPVFGDKAMLASLLRDAESGDGVVRPAAVGLLTAGLRCAPALMAEVLPLAPRGMSPFLAALATAGTEATGAEGGGVLAGSAAELDMVQLVTAASPEACQLIAFNVSGARGRRRCWVNAVRSPSTSPMPCQGAPLSHNAAPRVSGCPPRSDTRLPSPCAR